MDVALECYPLESVKGFEVKEEDSVTGWVPEATPDYLIRRGCVLTLSSPLATAAKRVRVTYTGGYVMPGGTVGPGEAALPSVLEAAAVEQVAMWYQLEANSGVFRLGGAGMSQSELGDRVWVPWAYEVVKGFRRFDVG